MHPIEEKPLSIDAHLISPAIHFQLVNLRMFIRSFLPMSRLLHECIEAIFSCRVTQEVFSLSSSESCDGRKNPIT